MTRKWEKLHLATDKDIPPLLFNYTSTSDRYDLYITDLTHLWSEQLSRKAILKRADETNTTIDPSEDAEQFKVLLQKIEETLRGEPGGSVTLNSGRNAGSLELVLLVKLPAPLRPLKWSVYLSKEEHSSSAKHLMFPLLREAAGFETRERALLDHLKQKDWVLAKIFDKIETMGIDLSTVFPGTSGLRGGRKGTTLEQAGKYIKGIAPFDESSWFDEVSKSSPDAGLAVNFVKEISGSVNNVESLGPARDKWWNNLPRHGTTPASIEEPEEELEEEAKEEQQPEAPCDEMEVDAGAGKETEDEFERQETPPRLKQQKQKHTEESPHARTEKQPQKQPAPQKPPPAKPSKPIGVIGGKKPTKKPSPSPSPQPDEETPTPTPSPEPGQEPGPEKPAPTTATTTSAADGETASEESDREPSPPPPKTQPKNPEPAKPQKKGEIGVIGGKKKAKSPSPPPEPAEPADAASSTDSEAAAAPARPALSPPPAKKKQPGRIGVIGGKKKEQPPPPEPEPSKPPEPSPAKRHTKLGIIGGKPKPKPSTSTKEPSSSPPHVAKHEPSRSPSRSPSPSPSKTAPKLKVEPEPEKEETEQEKADRKREELKRTLEAKSKAPVKKKRKF
ncbi:hypothetical protein PHISCL_07607 [Aspergillus sclerotialis]|uniref:Non-homologous end-joining factor 1 n=1 Tax=Aspergillus sclerotialis TaxID=2070753 RepID=A0A3A2ZAB5_9EURO|nr:hypothetical protein PHISCL_07607 [Aspergillus sclerotialis]